MIAEWLQKHKLSLLFLFFLLILSGLVSSFKLPVLLFPTLQFPRISVILNAEDRPADRMIIDITRPLEQALRAIPGIQTIRSTSSRDSVEISANFGWNDNIDLALLQVQSTVSQLLPTLPAGTTFVARKMDPVIFPVFGLSLTSSHKTLVDLRNFAYFQLRPLLLAVPGVANVEILGGQQEEFQVLVDPIMLMSYGLSFSDVVNKIIASNVTSSLGRMEDFYRLYFVVSNNQFKSIRDIQESSLVKGGDGTISIGDVAKVEMGVTPQWTRITANGQDAVLVNIIQQPGANTVSVVQDITRQLVTYKNQIPSDIQIKTYYDQSRLIMDSAQSVWDAIIIGAVFAVIVLMFFLRNIHMTFIVALILPCVIIASIVVLKFLNMSFNLMTLGGFAAAAGLIIDDGVVMIEHIMRRLSEQSHPKRKTTKYVVKACFEMLPPFAGSSLATIIIFLPLAFLSGVTGGFFKALAITITSTLVISFIFIFLFLVLLSDVLIKSSEIKAFHGADPFLSRLHYFYQRLMQKLSQKPLWIILIILSFAVGGYTLATQVGSGFMPSMDEGGFALDYKALPGTSLTETDRLVQQVEKIILTVPEVENYSRRTGLQLGGGLTEANTGDIFISLKQNRRRDTHQIMSDIRRKIETEVPGLRIETSQLMEDMIGDLTAVPQPIEIKIFGDDQSILQDTAHKTAQLISTVPGVIEIKEGIVVSGDAVDIKIKRVKASLQNLDPDVLTRQLQTLLTGTVVSQVQNGERMVGIRVWSSKKVREQLDQLKTLPIRTGDGHYISLQNVADISIQPGQVQITRENLKQMVSVTARIEGRDMVSTMNDIKQKMKSFILEPGVFIEYGGLYQQQKESFYQMIMVFLSAILLIFILLMFLYENIYIVVSIILISLLSISGSFFGLWLTNTELNISSMMGITMIIGIVTEIAIFYFSELNSYADHKPPHLILAGIKRMRPILMTSLIAIFALSPLAIGIGTASTMQQPLAISIIFGLVFAMPFVLILMPLFYLIITRRDKERIA